MLRVFGSHLTAIGKYNIRPYQRITGEAIASDKPSNSAAQRKSSNSGAADGAQRNDKAFWPKPSSQTMDLMPNWTWRFIAAAGFHFRRLTAYLRRF